MIKKLDKVAYKDEQPLYISNYYPGVKTSNFLIMVKHDDFYMIVLNISIISLALTTILSHPL